MLPHGNFKCVVRYDVYKMLKSLNAFNQLWQEALASLLSIYKWDQAYHFSIIEVAQVNSLSPGSLRCL